MSIVFDGTTIPGLVEDIQWGEWERAVQYQSVFGLKGVSQLDGGRKLREFVCPMKVYSAYVSQTTLDTALGTIDTLTGEVGTFVEKDPDGNTVRTITNVEFVGLTLGIKRYDSDLKWWANCQLRFRQLQPS